jgi:hypothetical protein
MIPLPVLPPLPWRLIGAAALVVAIAAMGWRVSAWREGYLQLQATEKALETSRAEARQCLDREVVAQRAWQDAAAAAESKAAADRATAERVERELEKRLADADLRGRDLARRLSDAARAGAGRGAVPAAPGAAGPADDAGGDAGRDAALAGVFAACERDAERLTGWQQWWAEVAP